MKESPRDEIQQIRKRDGSLVPFDPSRITRALQKALRATREGDPEKTAEPVSEAVVAKLKKKFKTPALPPQVEEIQDLVEETLIDHHLTKTAKAYILYRHERSLVREKAKQVPERVKRLALESKKYFKNPLAEFIYYRTYSRWIESEERRETWIETVDRYMDYMREILGAKLSDTEYQSVRAAILNQDVMPSMRLMWSAGAAARSTHAGAYNCAYVAPTCVRDLAEIMYLLMCGTGVGFSVETRNTQKFPLVSRQNGSPPARHRVADSKEGWAEALKLGLTAWFEGRDVEFDYSDLRPAGARLKTMGGRSSGPEPLKAALDFIRNRILSRQDQKLRNIDLHDVICKIGEVVVMGGVRRSALISLSDLDDNEMRHAKNGPFYVTHPERAMANNSVAYDSKPQAVRFLEEWLALAEAGTGERGIFNRGALKGQMPERRWPGFEAHWPTCGTNPCGEIILRSKQFCNLTEVVARREDDENSLLKKIEIASLLGTYQASLTHFPYLSDEWRKNCEEERLLGVSITGQWDSPASRNPAVLEKLKARAIEVNRKCAARFGINAAAAVTCVKPSGTVSQLVDSASGMHPRYAKYYLRRVRISATDPLFAMLKEQKFPYQPEVGQDETNAATFVLEFPVKSPEGAVVRGDVGTLEQLEYWKSVKVHFTEHNPSVTVTVGADEWIRTADWVYRHWDLVGGLSFLPASQSVYQLPPFEEISKEKFEALGATLPRVDFGQIIAYEKEDQTVGSGPLACTGVTCEIDLEEGMDQRPRPA